MVERETKRPLFGIVLAWAVSAVLAIALLAVLFRPNPELAIMNDVDGFAVAPNGRVFVSRSKGVVFIGARLPAIAANKIFELWVIPAKGNLVPPARSAVWRMRLPFMCVRGRFRGTSQRWR